MLADLTPFDKMKERYSQISEEIDIDPKIKYLTELDSKMEPAEFYFLLDRSGSMYGDPMETAKEAMILFLHSLPSRSKFNVISFGSNFESIFDGCVDYSQKTMDNAWNLIKGFQADLGGTEMFAPLHSIFADRDDSSGLTRHVFLLTDGAVFDPQQVIELIKNNSKHYYVHTFGIGNGASTELIVEWANAGNGKSYFVGSSASGLERKVIDALCKAFETKITIFQKDIAVNGEKSMEYPPLEKISSKMFHGDYFTYYCIINDVDGDCLKGALSMHIHDENTNMKKKLYIDLASDAKFIPGDSIFKMWWKNYFKELEKNRENEPLITKLSVKYQIPSLYTSFIGKE